MILFYNMSFPQIMILDDYKQFIEQKQYNRWEERIQTFFEYQINSIINEENEQQMAIYRNKTLAIKQHVFNQTLHQQHKIGIWNPLVEGILNAKLTDEYLVELVDTLIDKFNTCHAIICNNVPQQAIDIALNVIEAISPSQETTVLHNCYVASHDDPELLLTQVLGDREFMQTIDEHWELIMDKYYLDCFDYVYPMDHRSRLLCYDDELRSIFECLSMDITIESVMLLQHSSWMQYLQVRYAGILRNPLSIYDIYCVAIGLSTAKLPYKPASTLNRHRTSSFDIEVQSPTDCPMPSISYSIPLLFPVAMAIVEENRAKL